MKVHFEIHDTYRFHCTECKDRTSHWHKFYIKKDGIYVALKECKICRKETGTEILDHMTDMQIKQWNAIKYPMK